LHGSPRSPLAPSLRGSVGVPHRGVSPDAQPLAIKSGNGYRRLRDNGATVGQPAPGGSDRGGSCRGSRRRASRGGPRLVVADLSASTGGAGRRSPLHRHRRDADLLLYSLTPDGSRWRRLAFVAVGDDGLAEARGARGRIWLRVDLERTSGC
jgi:penicillin-insensitive murein endopeptidase